MVRFGGLPELHIQVLFELYPRTLTQNQMLYLRITWAAQSHPTSPREKWRRQRPQRAAVVRLEEVLVKKHLYFTVIPASISIQIFIFVYHTYNIYIYIYLYSSSPTIIINHQPSTNNHPLSIKHKEAPFHLSFPSEGGWGSQLWRSFQMAPRLPG